MEIPEFGGKHQGRSTCPGSVCPMTLLDAGFDGPASSNKSKHNELLTFHQEVLLYDLDQKETKPQEDN